MSVRVGEHHRVDLTWFGDGVSDTDHTPLIATEHLLGARDLGRLVGVVEAGSGTAPQDAVAPDALATRFDRVRADLVATLPKPSLSAGARGRPWMIFKLSPSEQDDQGQRDLFVARSAYRELWEAAHSGVRFAPERFSRQGETFAYVKLDGSEGLDEEAFADKSEIEDALDAVLKPDAVGAYIGGGTGLRYSYVDLALRELNGGARRVCMRGQEGRVPRRSWILFFDAELGAEWVGIYPDSPPPPGFGE